MSVSSLGGILRRLRRDIADRATFRNGTVVEMLDATHVLVDIGKPVPAFVSPIFLPAVVVGSPVTVRVQGSTYVVTDAPESGARLVTTTEMDSILARLTALEPSAANLLTELVGSDESAISTVGWSAYPDITEGEVYESPNWDMLMYRIPADSYHLTPAPAGTPNHSSIQAGSYAWGYVARPGSTMSPIRIYPLAKIGSVTAHPQFVAVTAGNPYTASCASGYWGPIFDGGSRWDGYAANPNPTARIGIEWFDAADDPISESLGSAAAFSMAIDAGIFGGSWWGWLYGDLDNPVQYDYATEYEGYQPLAGLNPSATFSAPTGAVKARPFVEYTSNGWWFFTAKFALTA